MKKLADILQGILDIKEIKGNTNIDIHMISQDTREDFHAGTLYIAVPGTQVDGHDYIQSAIDKGATAIVCERLPEHIQDGISYVVIDHVQKYIGVMASNFYDQSSQHAKIIAVTGTNGKTTIINTLYQALLLLGKKVAVFSTAGDFVNGDIYSTGKKAESSMEVIELHKNINKVVRDYQVEYICLEATSHALDQYRLNGISLDGAVFTNLTQDHLNYHQTFENYAGAKQRLFTMLDISAFALVNADSPYAEEMVRNTQAQIKKYGKYTPQLDYDYDFQVTQRSLVGTELLISGEKVSTQFIGEFNMYNLTAVFGVLVELGFMVPDVKNVIPRLVGAEGRMEIIKHPSRNIAAIVDYAHSPDALENVLLTLQEVPHNKIITVFGVGGGRDRAKRPLMGEIAVRQSDHVIITNDNPRDDDPEEIVEDITSSIEDPSSYEVIFDRTEAIHAGLSLAQDGDIILIAGKGHEKYQEIKGVKHPFSDTRVVAEFFK